MHDVLEGLEEHGGTWENLLMLPVTVTLSILAVLVAMVTLLGHRAHTEELLLERRPAISAYFQAKNIRLRETQSIADVLGALAPADKEKTHALHEKYLKEVERYVDKQRKSATKPRILRRGEGPGAAPRRSLRRWRSVPEDRPDYLFLHAADQKKGFWFAVMLLGVVGLIVATSGFLLH